MANIDNFNRMIDNEFAEAIRASAEAADREMQNLSAEDKAILDAWAKQI